MNIGFYACSALTVIFGVYTLVFATLREKAQAL